MRIGEVGFHPSFSGTEFFVTKFVRHRDGTPSRRGAADQDGADLSLLDWPALPSARRSHRREVLRDADGPGSGAQIDDPLLGKARGADSRRRRGHGGMYGDLQGVAGKAFEEIEGMELPLIESGVGASDDAASA